MYAPLEKKEIENKSIAVANSVAQKKNNVKLGFGFVDNQSEAIFQRKTQELREPVIQRYIIKQDTPGEVARMQKRHPDASREWLELPQIMTWKNLKGLLKKLELPVNENQVILLKQYIGDNGRRDVFDVLVDLKIITKSDVGKILNFLNAPEDVDGMQSHTDSKIQGQGKNKQKGRGRKKDPGTKRFKTDPKFREWFHSLKQKNKLYEYIGRNLSGGADTCTNKELHILERFYDKDLAK